MKYKARIGNLEIEFDDSEREKAEKEIAKLLNSRPSIVQRLRRLFGKEDVQPD